MQPAAEDRDGLLRVLLDEFGDALDRGGLHLALDAGDVDLVVQLAGPAGPSEMEQRLDIARIEGQVKASSVKKVADFVEKHPDESTAILRSWVHEG
jgi:flagellar biosynthesis/type III secretory pathway M-ring protein FliF/YscJ